MQPELTRDRIAYLEAKAADPDADLTLAELQEFSVAVRAALRAAITPAEIVYEDGVGIIGDAGTEAEWDRYYSTPVAEILVPLQAAVRVHAPPRFEGRVEARPRGRRRSSRRRAGPARPDDDPDLDLAALRVIAPEAFAAIVEGAGL